MSIFSSINARLPPSCQLSFPQSSTDFVRRCLKVTTVAIPIIFLSNCLTVEARPIEGPYDFYIPPHCYLLPLPDGIYAIPPRWFHPFFQSLKIGPYVCPLPSLSWDPSRKKEQALNRQLVKKKLSIDSFSLSLLSSSPCENFTKGKRCIKQRILSQPVGTV